MRILARIDGLCDPVGLIGLLELRF
jgi:hypothetical protein